MINSNFSLVQNSCLCVLCGKICKEKDWVVFDGLSGLCKCRLCMLTKLEPWKVPFVYSKKIGGRQL